MRPKVFSILKTFSSEDIRSFSKFLKSPYFNESKKLVRFYEIIIQYHPDFKEDSLGYESISRKLNPKLKHNESTVRALFSNLYNCCINYLMVSNFMNKEFESGDFLRNELFGRKLFRPIEENISQLELLNSHNSRVDFFYFLNRYQMLSDKANLINLTNPRKNKQLIDSSLDTAVEAALCVTYFYSMVVLKFHDNMKTLGQTYSLTSQQHKIFELFTKIDFTKLLNFLIQSASDKEHKTVLKIYLAFHLSSSFPKREKYYREYKSQLLNNISLLDTDEKRFHISYLIKYCMSKKNIERYAAKYDNELFQIYDKLLTKGHYKSTVTEYIPDELFRSILKHGLKLKKYNWIRNFIRKYIKKLLPERRKNMHNFSLAEYHFAKRQFKDALSYSHKIVLDDFIFRIDIKNLMLISTFELGDYVGALSIIDSYHHFLSNDSTLSSVQKQRYKNFVNAVSKLVAYKTSAQPQSTINIELALKKHFPNKLWVEEKLSAIIANLRKAV